MSFSFSWSDFKRFLQDFCNSFQNINSLLVQISNLKNENDKIKISIIELLAPSNYKIKKKLGRAFKRSLTLLCRLSTNATKNFEIIFGNIMLGGVYSTNGADSTYRLF